MHRYLSIILLVFSGFLSAEQGLSDERPVRCLNLNNIKQMTILDKQHIVFDMSGGKHYLNTLPYSCSGLHRSSAIMYRTSLNKLCDLDIITVLDDVGPGFRPLNSCGLGRFEAISDDEFRDLKTKIKTKRKPQTP